MPPTYIGLDWIKFISLLQGQNYWIRLDEMQIFVRKAKNIQPTFEKATLRRSRSTPRTGETLDSGGLPINT